MTGSCTCNRCESTHHHAWGGTYPCEGPALCIRCRPIEVHEFVVVKTKQVEPEQDSA